VAVHERDRAEVGARDVGGGEEDRDQGEERADPGGCGQGNPLRVEWGWFVERRFRPTPGSSVIFASDGTWQEAGVGMKSAENLPGAD
jgi:hypothetical protein